MKASHFIKGIIVILIITSHISCKTTKNNTAVKENATNHETIDQSIEDFFNTEDSIEIIANKEGNWLLYVSNKTVSASEPVNDIKFLVLNKSNQKILYKNTFSRSKVKWYDNEQLLLTKQLGIIDQKTGKGFIQYLIDIESNKMKEHNTDKESVE